MFFQICGGYNLYPSRLFLRSWIFFFSVVFSVVGFVFSVVNPVIRLFRTTEKSTVPKMGTVQNTLNPTLASPKVPGDKLSPHPCFSV